VADAHLAVICPFLRAMAAPTIYAQQAFSKAMVWMPFTMA
jgi:hypothetical protein